MSINDILESLQRKLQAAKSPIVARHTVAGIFATLRKPGVSVDARATVIALCLSRPFKVIVQEAADQLLALTRAGGLPAAEAAEFLLSAITTAGSATAAPLADALCQLTVSSAADIKVTGATAGLSDSAAVAQPLLRPARWTSHPLVAALLSCPAAATQLLSSAIAALGGALATVAAATAAATATAGGGGTGPAASAGAATAAAARLSLRGSSSVSSSVSSWARTWSSLEPFFSFVLLQRHASSAAERAGAGASSSAASASASSGASTLVTVALSAWLHGQLVRLAVGEPYGAPPWLRRELLDFLVVHLALGPRGAEADRMQAVQATTDLLDVLEASLYDSEGEVAATTVAGPLATALMQLAFEILLGPNGGGGGGGGAQEVVAALLRLQQLAPAALQNHLAELSLLTLNAHGKELQGLHRLLRNALRHSRQYHHGHQQQPPSLQQQQQQQQQQWQRAPNQTSAETAAADAAFSLQPLLAAVAFGTAAAPSGAVPASTWSAHLAAALQRVMDRSNGGSCGGDSDAASAAGTDGAGGRCPPGKAHGDLCLIRQCRWLLLSLWAEVTPTVSGYGIGGSSPHKSPLPCDLLRWLRSLELGLRQRRRMAAAAKAVSEQLPFVTKISDVVLEASLGAMDTHPALTCLLAALLAHSNPGVRAAAAAAARQLVQLLPAAALPLLPVVMYQLRRGGNTVTDEYSGISSSSSSSAAQLALLQLLPVMAVDPGVAPYALRVLQPMLQPESPEMLRCLALKLLCDTWLISGRGWPQVESALNGLGAPGSRDPPPSLRVTRAALLRAVCDRDPGRGLELVSALQQAIRDPDCPAAAALGLEALAVLAEEDVLDFYTAYRVVHRWHPSLPSDPLVASRWVALLAHGSLDAEAYPDKAAAILDILWSAARHPDAEVRAAAYSAISRYPLDLMEKLQILRPLSQYTAPLLHEADPRVSEAARGLAAVALRFEHANRRRLLMTQPVSDATHDQNTAGGMILTSGAEGGGVAGGRSKGAVFAAAATAREARALRGRLLGRIPKMLLAGANPAVSGAGRPPGGSGGGSGGGGGVAGCSFNPGTALFCYSRPPPPPLPPGSSAAAIAAAAKRAAAEARDAYGTRLRDGLRRLAWRGHWHARLAVQAWAAFVRHWMYDTGLTAADVVAALVREWDGTPPAAGSTAAGGAGNKPATSATAVVTGAAAPAAVLEGVGLAAGAFCVTAEGLPEVDVSFLTTKLLQQVQSGRSSGISRSSLLGAALAASRLHPTDWAARQQVLGELRAQLLAGPTAVVRSAAATALAVLAGSLAADPAIYIRMGGGSDGNVGDGGGGSHHSRELMAVAEAVSCLIAALGALCPALAAPLADLATHGMPPGWPSPEGAAFVKGPRPLKDEVDEQEVLPGTAVSLASLLCDVNRAHGLPTGALSHFLSALTQVITAAATAAGDGDCNNDHCSGASASATVTMAALESTAVLAPEIIRYQQMQASELSYVIRTVRELMRPHAEVEGETCGSRGSSVPVSGNGGDGRVRGAAAYCLACVAVAALRQGLLTPELISELGLSPAASAPASAAPSLRPGSEGAGPTTVLLAIVSELEEQACGGSSCGSGAATANKGQYMVAARMGAVAGLAAVLVPPPSSLVDALAPIPASALSTGLMAQPEHLAPAKAAVRALERLATTDTDPWVSAAAAFHLAAVSAAVEAAEDNGEDSMGPSGGGDGGAAGTAAAGAGTGGAGDGPGRASASTAGGGGGRAGSSGPKPLSLYPLEGAVRPLVTALTDGCRHSSLHLTSLPDTLLALAAAPALPAADWPTVCRTLLAKASGTAEDPNTAAAGVRLLAATLLLALAHGSIPSLGLGALLEELVAPTRFAALPAAVQGLILVRLPALLRSLTPKRSAAVVQGLPGLLATSARKLPPAGLTFDSTDGGGAGGAGFPWSFPAGLDEPTLQLLWLRRIRQSLSGPGVAGPEGGGVSSSTANDECFGAASWLSAHCWLGLLAVCRGWQAKDAALTHRDVTQATHTTIAELASKLPALPPLQPGEAAQLMAWAAAPWVAVTSGSGGGDDWESYGSSGRPLAAEVAVLNPVADRGGGGGGEGPESAARAAVTLWSLAACCLRCLRPEFLTTQVLTAQALTAETLTAQAVTAETLASLQLRCVLVASGHVSYRELMPVRTAAASAAVSAAGHVYGDPLLTPLSLALASTPQAFQVQVLLQTLDAARTAPQPGPSLELGAALVAAALGYATSAASAAAPELCVALSSRRAALECLPYTLPRLLSRSPWSSSCEAVAQALLAVAREGLRRGVQGPVVGVSKEADQAGDIVLTCLWALRDVLPAYTHDQLHATLTWQTLARVVDIVEV